MGWYGLGSMGHHCWCLPGFDGTSGNERDRRGHPVSFPLRKEGDRKGPGVRTDLFTAPHFKEFVVNFDGSGKKAADINAALLEKDIFGGKDLSREFSFLGESASVLCYRNTHSGRHRPVGVRRWRRRWNEKHHCGTIHERQAQPAPLSPSVLGRAGHLRAGSPGSAGDPGSGCGGRDQIPGGRSFGGYSGCAAAREIPRGCRKCPSRRYFGITTISRRRTWAWISISMSARAPAR